MDFDGDAPTWPSAVPRCALFPGVARLLRGHALDGGLRICEYLTLTIICSPSPCISTYHLCAGFMY